MCPRTTAERAANDSEWEETRLMLHELCPSELHILDFQYLSVNGYPLGYGGADN